MDQRGLMDVMRRAEQGAGTYVQTVQRVDTRLAETSREKAQLEQDGDVLGHAAASLEDGLIPAGGHEAVFSGDDAETLLIADMLRVYPRERGINEDEREVVRESYETITEALEMVRAGYSFVAKPTNKIDRQNEIGWSVSEPIPNAELRVYVKKDGERTYVAEGMKTDGSTSGVVLASTINTGSGRSGYRSHRLPVDSQRSFLDVATARRKQAVSPDSGWHVSKNMDESIELARSFKGNGVDDPVAAGVVIDRLGLGDEGLRKIFTLDERLDLRNQLGTAAAHLVLMSPKFATEEDGKPGNTILPEKPPISAGANTDLVMAMEEVRKEHLPLVRPSILDVAVHLIESRNFGNGGVKFMGMDVDEIVELADAEATAAINKMPLRVVFGIGRVSVALHADVDLALPVLQGDVRTDKNALGILPRETKTGIS